MKNKNFMPLLLASVLFFVLVANFMNSAPKKKTPDTPKLNFGCTTNNLTGMLDYADSLATFEGIQDYVPQIAFAASESNVLGLANEERWIEVDLSDQKLKAWEGDKLFLETLVSSGLPWYPTPIGEFRIWIKLRAAKMEGGQGRLYYYLPNVPYIMYFGNGEVPNYRGYGLHGTYWHDDFGTQRSHGCVNLPTSIAEQLYYWTGPVLSEGKSVVYSDGANQGTRIVIHQ